MPPEETSRQPASDPPRPSERISVDGLSPRPMQQPMPAGREVQRPYMDRRPMLTPPPVSTSTQPPAPSIPPTPTPPSAPTPISQPPTQPPQPVPAREPLQFKAPSTKKRRRFLLPALLTLAVLLIAAGIGAWVHVNALRNNPDTAIKDALLASLEVRQLETQTTAGAMSSDTQYDFTSPTNPLISNKATFQMNGASFQGTAYGSLQNTYFSYTKLPENVPAPVASVTLDAWIQLRSKGVLPAGINPTLTSLTDPRVLDYGPVLFGNYPQKTREQLVNFMLAHVYSYQKTQVKHTTLGGTKVFAYPVKLDTGFLNIVVESAAVTAGLSPADVQSTIGALDNFQGADVTLYVDTAQHRIQEITLSKGGQTTTITYSHYNNVTLPDEPATKLTWQEFAPLETQIESPKPNPTHK